MLNALLDINQIDAGVVGVDRTVFSLNTLLNELRDEFIYHAQAKGLALHVVPCSLMVETDARLLEQMLRNLLTNALKYTKTGKVLLGCRRRGEGLSIAVIDTGVGIAASELSAIFDEYHQLDNTAGERARGLGLGLSIVQRLGALLGHPVRVTSKPGKGSAFAIDITQLSRGPTPGAVPPPPAHLEPVPRLASILIVEDDPEVCGLLALALTEAGHQVAAASDGLAALEMVTQNGLRPDLILADYSLPHGMQGLRLAEKLRGMLQSAIPVIILTGDISTDTLRDIAASACQSLHKPVKLAALTAAVQSALTQTTALPALQPPPKHTPIVYIIDDDGLVLEEARSVLEDDGFTVESFADGEAFLRVYKTGREGCLLLDARLPGIGGLALLKQLRATGDLLPVIMITGVGDVAMATEAMKAGAMDFIEKPVNQADLLASVERALAQAQVSSSATARRDEAIQRLAKLTPRQRDIMTRVLAGHPSKNIAADLGISRRTVENHRAAIMTKTGAKSLPALARLALAAGPAPA